MNSNHCIGIDFGTTNTSVVCIQDTEHGNQKTYLGEEGSYPFSSIVAIPREGGNLLFGKTVRNKRQEFSETHEIFTSMKSYLGKKEEDGTPFSFLVGDKRYYPKDIVQAFFEYVKSYIKENFKIDIDSASVSYPVDFSSDARRELKDALKMAGIEVKIFANESTSAYIESQKQCKSFSKIMVLDWGGGTLDISILKIIGNNIHEVAVLGDNIGGDDIDLELAERIHSRIVNETKIDGGRFNEMQPKERDQLIARCEQVKIAISEDNETYPLRVLDYGAYGTKITSITPDDFNDIVKPIIENRVLRAIEKVLVKAGKLSPSSIDCIIIVGGSSNLKIYQDVIMNQFQHAEIVLPSEPQWATAIGVALIQLSKTCFKLSDDVGLLLSDDTVFTIMEAGLEIGKQTKPITFSIVEDTLDAHFIFVDKTGKNIYKRESVPTKGYLDEKLKLTAQINDDQIAYIKIENANFGNDNLTTITLNKLNFYYDITNIKDCGDA